MWCHPLPSRLLAASLLKQTDLSCAHPQTPVLQTCPPGVCHPLPGLECYLLATCPLAARLLKTARMVTPAHLLHLLPPGGNVGPGELLVAMVHRCVVGFPPGNWAWLRV